MLAILHNRHRIVVYYIFFFALCFQFDRYPVIIVGYINRIRPSAGADRRTVFENETKITTLARRLVDPYEGIAQVSYDGSVQWRRAHRRSKSIRFLVFIPNCFPPDNHFYFHGMTNYRPALIAVNDFSPPLPAPPSIEFKSGSATGSGKDIIQFSLSLL